MTNKNDALFLVSLPFGQKTIPYGEVPALIAMAKSPGYDCENASEHEGEMFALGVIQEQGQFKAAVRAGEVEVLNKSFHRISPPFSGARPENALLTLQAFREYVESIYGFVEVEDAPEPQQKVPAPETATPAPVVAGGLTKPHSSKLPKTLIFEEKVLELMDKFWNEKPLGTEPTKGDLCKKVYDEILRTTVRGTRKTTQGMVIDAAKPWKCPIVLPAFVPDSRFKDKRHPFKAEK